MMGSDRPIRVMTVDDSTTIRRLISAELSRCPDIQCLDGGANPYEARVRIKAEAPDVLLLDVEMPRMNGIEFLDKIMTLRPMPVIMFSSLTHRGSEMAIEALKRGAVDVMVKTAAMSTDGTLASLPDRVRMAARARLTARSRTLDQLGPDQSKFSEFRNRGNILMIGSSTGGVDALETVLRDFPSTCPPTLISQHMPEEFLRNFALRLNSLIQPLVKLAEDGEPLSDGVVYIAPGGRHHLALAGRTQHTVFLDPQDKVSGHRPSVDVMFRSGVPVAGKIVAAILTGMGSDGARGMKDLRDAGARTLAQDEATCTVFGMPRVALDLGGAERALPLGKIAAAMLELCTERSTSIGNHTESQA